MMHARSWSMATEPTSHSVTGLLEALPDIDIEGSGLRSQSTRVDDKSIFSIPGSRAPIDASTTKHDGEQSARIQRSFADLMPGLSGTATAPTYWIAQNAVTNSMELATSITTRSPRPTPSCTS